MHYINRPDSINKILGKLTSEENSEIYVDLKEYMADLESKQPNRPDYIQDILEHLTQRVPSVAETLDFYLYHLEANQLCQQDGQSEDSVADDDKLPAWSHERAMQRQRHRQKRAIRKQNNYQGLKTL